MLPFFGEPVAVSDTQCQCWRTERTILFIQPLHASCDLTSVHHLSLFICYLDWGFLPFTVILYMKLFRNLSHSFLFSRCRQYCHIVFKVGNRNHSQSSSLNGVRCSTDLYSSMVTLYICSSLGIPNNSKHLIWPLLSTEHVFVELSVGYSLL